MAKTADNTENAAPVAAVAVAPQPTMVVMAPQQHAAQTLAAELADMRAKGIKLNETKPGGYFLGADGRAHDAHGNILGAKTATGDVSALGFDDVSKELHENEQRRLALLGRVEAARAEALAAANEPKPATNETG